jgi:hypothetical protein
MADDDQGPGNCRESATTTTARNSSVKHRATAGDNVRIIAPEAPEIRIQDVSSFSPCFSNSAGEGDEEAYRAYDDGRDYGRDLYRHLGMRRLR